MEADSVFVEPSPRWGHCSAAIEGQVYVYGGRTKDFLKDKDTLASQVHLFDPYLESWREVETQGSPPPALHGSVCTPVGHHIYSYGGYDGREFYGQSLYYDFLVKPTLVEITESVEAYYWVGAGSLDH